MTVGEQEVACHLQVLPSQMYQLSLCCAWKDEQRSCTTENVSSASTKKHSKETFDEPSSKKLMTAMMKRSQTLMTEKVLRCWGSCTHLFPFAGHTMNVVQVSSVIADRLGTETGSQCF